MQGCGPSKDSTHGFHTTLEGMCSMTAAPVAVHQASLASARSSPHAQGLVRSGWGTLGCSCSLLRLGIPVMPFGVPSRQVPVTGCPRCGGISLIDCHCLS